MTYDNMRKDHECMRDAERTRLVQGRPRGTREDDEMSQCDHTWVMDDSPRPACHKCFMERDACALADRIATLERELAEARQMLKEQDGRTPMLDAMERVAGDAVALADAVVVAERDELKKQLAAVTAERDALLKGTRAGPWEHDPERPWGTATCETWNRRGPFSASVTVVRRPDPVEPMSVWGMAPGMSRAFASADEAKVACDAALVAAGWYLAPTPPTGTPGAGTR